MGKKNRNKQKCEERSARASSGLALGGHSHGTKPTVLFGVGDADYGYTEGKILRLASRVQSRGGYNLKIVTHDNETSQEARKLGLEVRLVPIESPGVTVEERLRTTDEMIRETANIDIPGSTLPLWKVLAMDDFLCSLQLFGAQPADSLEGDLVVAPLMSVDNNTKAASGLYTWMVSEARRLNIPVLGFEVSPLGNKYTLSHLPADHYAVKNEWSKKFLVQEGLAHPEAVSVLKWEESYCLWSGHDDYTESYLEHEPKIREMLNIGWDEFVILIPHHVAFLWEVRKVLESLASLDFPVTVIIRVDPRTVRRHYVERELVLETYANEIRCLPRVIIDERVGVGLLLQLADLVISPFAGTTTERASLCRKPTIICQAMGQQGSRGEFVCWDPRPERIPQLIGAWREKGFLARRRFDQSISAVLDRKPRSSLGSGETQRCPAKDVELDVATESL